jgi:hypothetical protein
MTGGWRATRSRRAAVLAVVYFGSGAVYFGLGAVYALSSNVVLLQENTAIDFVSS